MTHSVLLVAVAGLVTLALRAAPFLILGGERKTPEFISYLGRVLPSAVMGMLVIYCLRNVSFAAVSNWLPQLLCCGVVVLVHVLKRSTLLSIVCGTVCYMILVQHII
ncbi:MAG: AzlD domain-containing protein [Oscillospiraceae bacterium]|nr:AzlD domain-containing protein [Oscillospiraceae bacterium]